MTRHSKVRYEAQTAMWSYWERQMRSLTTDLILDLEPTSTASGPLQGSKSQGIQRMQPHRDTSFAYREAYNHGASSALRTSIHQISTRYSRSPWT